MRAQMSHKGALIHNKGSHQAKHPTATRCLYSADPVGSPTRGLLYIIIYYRGVAYSRPIRSSALAKAKIGTYLTSRGRPNHVVYNLGMDC